jgi:hypothetical protein
VPRLRTGTSGTHPRRRGRRHSDARGTTASPSETASALVRAVLMRFHVLVAGRPAGDGGLQAGLGSEGGQLGLAHRSPDPHQPAPSGEMSVATRPGGPLARPDVSVGAHVRPADVASWHGSDQTPRRDPRGRPRRRPIELPDPCASPSNRIGCSSPAFGTDPGVTVSAVGTRTSRR